MMETQKRTIEVLTKHKEELEKIKQKYTSLPELDDDFKMLDEKLFLKINNLIYIIGIKHLINYLTYILKRNIFYFIKGIVVLTY